MGRAGRGVPRQQHFVVHAKSGRKLSYGEFVPLASTATAPQQSALRFKTPKEFRYIGKDVPLTDLNDLVTGKGTFGIDARMPGMVYASIERPPVMGSTLKSLDDSAAKQVAGVQQVVTLETAKPPFGFKPLGGVAVIASNTWAALQGRNELKVEWTPGEHGEYESAAYRTRCSKRRASPAGWRGRSATSTRPSPSGKTTHEASYYTPMLAHAPMEPPAAVAEFKDGKVVTYARRKTRRRCRRRSAKALGIPKETSSAT